LNTYDALLAILKEDSDESEEQIDALIRRAGWEPVRDGVYKVLLDPAQREHGRAAAAVFWGAVLDQRPLDPDRTIAVLYRNLRDQPAEAPSVMNSLENLVWSITAKLKNKGYLSDYDPLEDPGVKRELERLT